MSINLDFNSLNVEKIGRTVNVPNNDLARLMYYLNCISAVIQYDEQNKLIDYQRYYDLNKEEENAVYALAIVLNPKIFIDAKVLVINPNLVPQGYNNEFYRITDDRVGFHVNEEIVIGERVVRVLKIMACSSSWLEKYYFKPMENINKGNSISYSNNNYSSNYNYNQKKCNLKCFCKWFWLFMFAIWMVAIICKANSGSDSD